LIRALFPLGLVLALAGAAELKQSESDAFDRHTLAIERAIESSQGQLWFESHAGRLAVVRSGKVSVEPALGKPTFAVDGALVHDWVAAAFVPGGRAADLVALLQDADRAKNHFGPEVNASRLIRRDGDTLVTYIQLKKKKIITVLLDSEYLSRFYLLPGGRGYNLARSTKIQEIRDPGSRKQRTLPPGTGYGFLWRINSYWVWQERDGGLYFECRVISLTRDIPRGLGWILEPMVTSLPRESLTRTVESARAAVIARQHPASASLR
jgi:hypothetical protein